MARTFPGTLSGGFADDYLENSSTAWIDTPPFSLVAWVYWTEAAALPESVLGMNNDGNPQVRFQLNITTGYLQCWISDGTNIPTVVDTVKFPVSTWTHIGVTIEAGSPGTARLWKNGSNIASDTATNIASGAWGMTYSFLAEWPFGGSHYYEFEGSIALVAAYDVALSSTDFTDLYTRKKHPLLVKPQNLVGLPNLRGTGNAGGIIGPTLTEAGTVTESNDPPGIIYPSGPIFVVPGVAGGTTIDRQPGAGALTLAGQTPTVSFTFDRAPAAGALTIAGQTPSTALAIDRAPAAGALTLTGQAPTIAFVFDRAPAAGTLTLAGAAPATALAFVRAPGAGALTIAGQTPTAGVALDRKPGAGALILAGQAPSIALAFVRAPAVGALTIAGQTPTVNTSIDRQPSAGALTLAGQAPAIALNFRRAPGLGTMTLTGQSPALALDFRLAPALGTLTVAGLTPAVTVTGGVFSPYPYLKLMSNWDL